MNADGSNKRNLTQGRYRDESPIFSPDGKRVYFARAKNYRRNSTFGFTWDDWDIYSIKVDGTDERKITAGSYYLLCCLSYSPPEEALLFAAIIGSSYPPATTIFLVKADGRVSPTIIRSEKGISNPHPVLSPDGKKIAFVSQGVLPEYQGEFHIFLMNSDGGQVEQLTRNRLRNSYPAFASDGKKLFFLSRSEYGDRFTLNRINIDGSALTQITIF
jgi:Tol biopolymer transport system component